MTEDKDKLAKDREKMKKHANEADMTSSKALQDDALTQADKPIKTDLNG